jgi:hypothetical protein
LTIFFSAEIITLDRKHLQKKNTRKSQNVVIVLADFALKLMKALQRFNIENFLETNPGQLRIGEYFWFYIIYAPI